MSDKTQWITKTRCTEPERKVIDITAVTEGIKPPEALRMLVREGAKSLGYWRIAVAPKDDILRVLSSTLNADPAPIDPVAQDRFLYPDKYRTEPSNA